MTPHQALRTITIDSARMACADKDLGSLRPESWLTSWRCEAIHGRASRLRQPRVGDQDGNVYTQAQILAPFNTPLLRLRRAARP